MDKVLVLDDNADVVETLKDMLKGEFEVVALTDPSLALQALRRGGIKVLVTDILMPGLDGFDLISEARKLSPDLPVLVISAYIDEEDSTVRRLLDRYSVYTLVKPVARNEVITLVRHLASQATTGPQPPMGAPASL